MNLSDLFSLSALAQAIERGHVVRREHPTAPIRILNYTERCAHEPDAWNDVTRQCRGLIYSANDGKVLARPFPKFFNYGQPEAPRLDADEPVITLDKLDGSLGILYPMGVGHAIATRGSFDSEQAVHATELLRSRYASFSPPLGVTTLFEIIYPQNRVVVDYGDRDELVLLGGINIVMGFSLFPNSPLFSHWPGARAEVFTHSSLREALAAAPRPNAEGLVVFCFNRGECGERVKIKQADYVALHKIVTGLNERTVWAHVSAGLPLSALLDPIPDEFHDWVRQVAHDLVARIELEEAEIEAAFASIVAELPADHSRKDFALRVADHPLKHALFAKLDGKDYRPTLWRNARPEPRRTPTGVVRTEAAA